MRLSKTLAAIFLCATTLTLPANVDAARPLQKPRAKTQAPAPQTEITKEKIEAIVAAVHQAAKKKDAALLISYLAPDLKYKLEGGGRPPRHMNRAQYVETLRRVFEHALDYTYLIKSLNITIAPDGQSATAQTDVFEMITFAQGTAAANVTSTATFKIYKGKILIASMDGTITYV
ncbi:MAG TPA: nuclear transport factor 2 family protein [Pyrinomonadaceae bacterium]|nr:nuclear transport factor 2 family protein [Pyrinomonadaceae bacterium]